MVHLKRSKRVLRELKGEPMKFAKSLIFGLLLGLFVISPPGLGAQQPMGGFPGGFSEGGGGGRSSAPASPFDLQTQSLFLQGQAHGLFPGYFALPQSPGSQFGPQIGAPGPSASPCAGGVGDPRRQVSTESETPRQEPLSRIEGAVFLSMLLDFSRPGEFFNEFFSQQQAPQPEVISTPRTSTPPRPGQTQSPQREPAPSPDPAVTLSTILAGVSVPAQYQGQLNALRAAFSQAGARSGSTSSSRTLGSKQAEGQSPSAQQQAPAPALVLPFEPLRQFGYNLFDCPFSTFTPVDEAPVGPDYVLGPGDNLLINLWGGIVDNSITQIVNRNGEILLPKVGPVRVWGLTFSQAERVVRAQLSRYFRGFQTGLTLGRLRTIKVYMVGDTTRPGSYTLSSLSTLTNALTIGTGPAKLGSLREIKLLRNGHTVGTIDLYDFLLKGNRAQDFRLESGDTIFVPAVGPVAAVAGEVKRPAIYELKGSTKITDLIEMAGGLTSMAYVKRVQILRAVPGKERSVVDVDLTNGGSGVGIQDGDVVRVLAINPRVYNMVTLEGAINYPGTREFKPGMRVSQLLAKADVLPEAYLDRVEVERKLPENKTELLELNLRKLWSGDEAQDLPLSPQDRITVRTDVRPSASVTLSGEVKRPGIYRVIPGERLTSVLRRAGGLTEKAYLHAALFTRQSAKRIEKEQLDKFVQAQEAKLLAEAGTLVVAGVDREEVGAQSQTVNNRRELLNVLASRVALGRVVIKLDDIEKLEGSPSDLLMEDGDSLHIPTPPSSVAIVGAVRNPTSVVYQEGADVEYYLNRAGGLTPEADRKGVYIQKADGSALTGFSKIRKVEAGDALIIPPKAETQYRPIPIARDLITVFSQTLLSIASLAALVALVP